MRGMPGQAQFHVAPEIEDDGAQRAHMDRDVDHLSLIVEPERFGSRIRWPEDETGRNSVIPWINATRRR
jgi:hypothetical protein